MPDDLQRRIYALHFRRQYAATKLQSVVRGVISRGLTKHGVPGMPWEMPALHLPALAHDERPRYFMPEPEQSGTNPYAALVHYNMAMMQMSQALAMMSVINEDSD